MPSKAAQAKLVLDAMACCEHCGHKASEHRVLNVMKNDLAGRPVPIPDLYRFCIHRSCVCHTPVNGAIEVSEIYPYDSVVVVDNGRHKLKKRRWWRRRANV